MYYYAYIDLDTGVCLNIEEFLEPINEPFYIPLDEYDENLITRKKWDGEKWIDSTASEAQVYDAKIIGVNGEWLDDKIVAMCEDIENHTHDEYSLASDLELLQDIIDTKADSSHTHDGYASVSHSHSGYVTTVSFDTLTEEVDGKADVSHSHNEYALSSHEHDNYAVFNHNHDTGYAPIAHSHSDYVTTTDFNALESEVEGKAVEGAYS